MTQLHAKMMQLIALVDKDLAARARKSAFCYQHREWMWPIQSPHGTYYTHERPAWREQRVRGL
jgi:hypothetical protein